MSKWGRRNEAIRVNERPLEAEAAAIAAAHPFHTERHDLYNLAMRMVGERHEKAELVALVNWLLHRIEAAEAPGDAHRDLKPGNASKGDEHG